MQDTLLRSVSTHYEALIPQSQEPILILVALYRKIQNNEIDEAFTQHDFEQAVAEVSEAISRDKQIQAENISKKLSQYFYTTLKRGNEYRYQLTVFATDLVRIMLQEIQPEFENIELIHTFKRTLQLVDEDLKSIQTFEYWYLNHYQPSRRVVLSHTENLQRMVDDRTIALRQLMKNNIENTKGLITSFINIFEELGRQSEGLTQTLTFKQNIFDSIKAAEVNFLDKKDAWEKYTRIRSEIERFFENIDNRMLSINDRIQLSVSRLKALYDTLQYKQLYKLKMEKLLMFMLRGTKADENGDLKLPEPMQAKRIPYHRSRLPQIPKLDFANVEPADVPDFLVDAEYLKVKEQQNYNLLARQESISMWLESINKDLMAGKSILFDDWFKNIYAKEKNLEVPIDVCFGLIQRYGKNKDIEFVIDKTKPFYPKEDLALWKMKIQTSNS
ncbi:MAG: hypothetical protein HYU69_10210 [Bacteroidetes bacterium]|nr:hypothetical protein [Bacteroidota bacterium]